MLCLSGLPQSILPFGAKVLILLQGINGLSALNAAIPSDVREALGATPHLRFVPSLHFN
jgi:hypothetical protein